MSFVTMPFVVHIRVSEGEKDAGPRTKGSNGRGTKDPSDIFDNSRVLLYSNESSDTLSLVY